MRLFSPQQIQVRVAREKDAHVMEVATLLNHLDALRKQLNELNEAVEQKKREALQAHEQTVAPLRHEVRKLEQELSELEARRVEAMKPVDALFNEAHSLKSLYETRQAESETYALRLREKEQKLRASESELTRKSSALAQAETDLVERTEVLAQKETAFKNASTAWEHQRDQEIKTLKKQREEYEKRRALMDEEAGALAVLERENALDRNRIKEEERDIQLQRHTLTAAFKELESLKK